MNSLKSFPWPSPRGESGSPDWNGSAFISNHKSSRILAYTEASSHWSDDLTSLHEAEAGRHHPIDIASRKLAVRSMLSCSRPRGNILDVGSSSGFVLEDLQKALPDAGLIGSDYLQGPLERLAERIPNIPLLQFDLRKCPLPSECLDGITCLNVLEHIDDDRSALGEIYRLLHRGGVAHIEVPSGPHLYDIYDEHLMHHRRYHLAQLVQLAREMGFEVKKATHLGFSVYPAFAWVKHCNRKKLGSSPEEKKRLVATQIRSTRSNPIFQKLIEVETSLGHYFSYPFGIRCVVVLSKN